jgi:tetratricopeptide (TPR) repeat protein
MTSFGLPSLNSWDYLKTEAAVIVHYLRLCFWPSPLVIDYNDWPIAQSLDDVLVCGSVVIALLGATLWAFRRQPWLGFLGAWFFLILAPTSSILPSAGEVIAERRMYLPLVAVVACVVLAFDRLLRQRQKLGAALLLGTTATLTTLTIRRNADYRSDVSIWADAVNKRPNNARAHLHLGDALMARGRLQESIDQYTEALRLSPDYGTVHIAMGVALGRQGRLDEAIEHFSRAVTLGQELTTACFNLGVALARKGRFDEAARSFESALRIDPDSKLARGALQELGSRAGRSSTATQAPDAAVRPGGRRSD